MANQLQSTLESMRGDDTISGRFEANFKVAFRELVNDLRQQYSGPQATFHVELMRCLCLEMGRLGGKVQMPQIYQQLPPNVPAERPSSRSNVNQQEKVSRQLKDKQVLIPQRRKTEVSKDSKQSKEKKVNLEKKIKKKSQPIQQSEQPQREKREHREYIDESNANEIQCEDQKFPISQRFPVLSNSKKERQSQSSRFFSNLHFKEDSQIRQIVEQKTEKQKVPVLRKDKRVPPVSNTSKLRETIEIKPVILFQTKNTKKQQK